jgi:hypothetical protein
MGTVFFVRVIVYVLWTNELKIKYKGFLILEIPFLMKWEIENMVFEYDGFEKSD